MQSKQRVRENGAIVHCTPYKYNQDSERLTAPFLVAASTTAYKGTSG